MTKHHTILATKHLEQLKLKQSQAETYLYKAMFLIQDDIVIKSDPSEFIGKSLLDLLTKAVKEFQQASLTIGMHKDEINAHLAIKTAIRVRDYYNSILQENITSKIINK